MRAKLGESFANFLCQRAEISDDHFRLAIETRPQGFVLCRDAHGQVFRWHWRAMTQPMAIKRSGAKAKFVCAKSRADKHIAGKSQAAVHAKLDARAQASARQECHAFREGRFPKARPVFLIEVSGEEPVPPLWPLTVMTSAPALATPAAMTPTPAPETSFTPMRALGFTARKSWISCARSSML